MTVIPSEEDSNNNKAKKMIRVLVAGSSYGGLSVVKRFLKLSENINFKNNEIKITLVDPKPGFINVMAIPQAMIDLKSAKNSYTNIENYNLKFDSVRLLNNSNSTIKTSIECDKQIGLLREDIGNNNSIKLEFIQGYIKEFIPNKNQAIISKDIVKKFNLHTGLAPPASSSDENNIPIEEEIIDYDYCVLATGRSRSWPYDPIGETQKTFIKEMETCKSKIENSNIISIIGGGALGIELAGELKQTYPEKQIQLIHPHALLPPESLISDNFKEKVIYYLTEKLGVKLFLNTRILKEDSNSSLITTNNETIKSDLNLWCNKHLNYASYLKPDYIVNKDEVNVNNHLQLKDSNTGEIMENVYACGDLTGFPIIKKAGYAYRQGEVAATNIFRQITAQLQLDNDGQKIGQQPLEVFKYDESPVNSMVMMLSTHYAVSCHSLDHIDENDPAVLGYYHDYRTENIKYCLGLE
ncbi:hypothetical protein BVG19_g5334 [[Candida] boidinii]|nr:hypothetical protein BVG19_g5334 [[Candida] boidinii]OWB53877.1 hypothetical protein B5S27_g5490 [[Candida] boidinii]OWB85584.1 hypothetical protein B5S33_g4253 [[Candida] boidinii]